VVSERVRYRRSDELEPGSTQAGVRVRGNVGLSEGDLKMQELLLEGHKTEDDLSRDEGSLAEETGVTSYVPEDLEGEDDEGADAYTSSYDVYGLERSLEIYFRENCQHPLLTKEEEISLFIEMERGKKMVREAISETHLRSDLTKPDLREAVAKIDEAAQDIPFLRTAIADISSGKQLTECQVKRLMQMVKDRDTEHTTGLNTRDLAVSYDQAMDIAQTLLRNLQRELGVDNCHLNSIRSRVYRGMRLANAAREQIIKANLRLVVSVARKYKGVSAALSASDLIQEENVGLMNAVDRFDYRKGYRFSTYDFWWIRQSISLSPANCDRVIRLPPQNSKT